MSELQPDIDVFHSKIRFQSPVADGVQHLAPHVMTGDERLAIERVVDAVQLVANPDYWLEVCVTHWRIYQVYRAEPFAEFGFHLCPVEEGTEHVVVNFAALGMTDDNE